MIAPVIGGTLTTYASWRWIFLDQSSVGRAGAGAGASAGARLRAPAPDRLDWLGLVTSTAGLGAFVYGVSLVGRSSVPLVAVSLLLVASAGLLGVAVWHLLRTAVPLIDLRTLSIRTFRASQTGGSLYRISILAIPFLLPLMFQDAFGWSAARPAVS